MRQAATSCWWSTSGNRNEHVAGDRVGTALAPARYVCAGPAIRRGPDGCAADRREGRARRTLFAVSRSARAAGNDRGLRGIFGSAEPAERAGDAQRLAAPLHDLGFGGERSAPGAG